MADALLKRNPPDETSGAQAEDTLLSCSRCATCLPACPSYGATMLETYSPRGRVQLVRAVREGRLEPSERLRGILDACLDCRACESVCPNGIRPGQLALEVRAGLQPQASFSRWVRRLVLGAALSRPSWQEGGAQAVRLTYQRTGLQHLLRSTGLLRGLAGLERLDRYLPPISARSARRTLPEVVPASGERRGRVGYFLGCAMNTLFADTARHTVAVLSRLGFEVVIPREVVCCGAPQMTLGERDLAREMARRNLGCFEGLDLVVTDCAACGAELKHYPELLDEPSAKGFSARVRDLSEVVEPLLPEGLGLEGSATYHAPCHLAHGQGTCGPPKALLRRLFADYRELPEHDRCCGSAGVYWATHPAISDHALARKLAALRSTGAETVVTANPGCVLQLLAGLTGEDRWVVAHLSDVLYQALANGSGASDSSPVVADSRAAALAHEDDAPQEAVA